MIRMIRYTVAVYVGLLIAGAIGPVPTTAEAETARELRRVEPAQTTTAGEPAALRR